MPQRAKKTFFVGRRAVKQDCLVADDDPILEGRLHLFVPVDAFGRTEAEALASTSEADDGDGDDSEDGQPLDRDALLARATELGVTVHSNWKDETIARKVAEAEAETAAGPSNAAADTDDGDGDQVDDTTGGDPGDGDDSEDGHGDASTDDNTETEENP